MNLRKRGRRWSAEIYDPAVASKKRYVGTYDTEREAREAGRSAEAEVARRRGRRGDETVAGWAARWLDLKPRQKETTNVGYREQVKPFAERYGKLRLREVDVQLALEWLGEKRWTHGGLRAMFTDARNAGFIDTNPFTGLRLAGSHGRKNLDVLAEDEVHRLCDCALEVWPAEIGLTVRALISVAAFVGARPAEIYALRWVDLDLREDEVRIERQYSPRTRSFQLPKNGLKRTVVLTTPARAALANLPRAVNGDELIFRGARGRPITGRTQHYYWHPVRCRFGRPSMDFYELRHFCGAWLFNDHELPAQDVAHQLGHTDGGALVQRLYGHPSESLARERIKRAVGGNVTPLRSVTEAERRQAQ
jgi:integrase